VEAIQHNVRKLSGLETQKVSKISQKYNLEKQIHQLESQLKKEKGLLAQFPMSEKKIHNRLASLREEVKIIEEKQRQLSIEQNDGLKTFGDTFINALKTAISIETKPNREETSSTIQNETNPLFVRIRKLETLLESKTKQYEELDKRVAKLSDELTKVQAPVVSADQLDATVGTAVDAAKIKLAGALKADIVASETKMIQEIGNVKFENSTFKSDVEENIKSQHKKLDEFRAEQEGKDQALPEFIASSVTTSIASKVEEQIAEQLQHFTQRQDALGNDVKSLTEGQETLEKGLKEIQETLQRSIDHTNGSGMISPILEFAAS